MSRTHGKPSTYTHGCRCDACRAAHAAYARASGANRRVGRRKEIKDRSEEKARHPCAECGTLVHRQSILCRGCAVRRQRAPRREIERRWQAGETLKQIAAALDTTPNVINVTIAKMRKNGGYDVPHRYRRRLAESGR